jgi:hypothetical protein
MMDDNWLYESSPATLSEADENELEIGFCGQLNCGLKIEQEFEYVQIENHSMPNQLCREEVINVNNWQF